MNEFTRTEQSLLFIPNNSHRLTHGAKNLILKERENKKYKVIICLRRTVLSGANKDAGRHMTRLLPLGDVASELKSRRATRKLEQWVRARTSAGSLLSQSCLAFGRVYLWRGKQAQSKDLLILPQNQIFCTRVSCSYCAQIHSRLYAKKPALFDRRRPLFGCWWFRNESAEWKSFPVKTDRSGELYWVQHFCTFLAAFFFYPTSLATGCKNCTKFEKCAEDALKSQMAQKIECSSWYYLRSFTWNKVHWPDTAI